MQYLSELSSRPLHMYTGSQRQAKPSKPGYVRHEKQREHDGANLEPIMETGSNIFLMLQNTNGTYSTSFWHRKSGYPQVSMPSRLAPSLTEIY